MQDRVRLFPNARIPWGIGGSSYFPAWHASPFAETSIGQFAAESACLIMGKGGVSVQDIDYLVSGATIPWPNEFWGAPYLAACMERRVPGVHVSQACATGLKAVLTAAAQIESGAHHMACVLTFDRTSNSPAVVYPAQPTYRRTEVVSNVWDHFGCDPSTKGAMITTAGNAARKHGITRQEVDAIALLRSEQYAQAIGGHMLNKVLFPLSVLDHRGQLVGTVERDEGVRPLTAEGLRALSEIDTCVTSGGQTHPSDGMATLLVTSVERARVLSPDVDITFVAATETRSLPSLMPEAPALAAQELLQRTGLTIKDMSVVKTHNPFAVNDAIFSRLLKIDLERMNRTGCPLIYGHPQGPTLTRVLLEALAESVSLGGGYVLVCGCAAGDVGIAAILNVSDGKGGA